VVGLDENVFRYSEAETQVLIALIELASPKETPNNNFYTFYPKTLDEAASYFRKFRVDWTPAYESLLAKGLLTQKGPDYALTEAGRVEAERLRAARPPIWYWYEEFYDAAPDSPAYAHYCERVYGGALCQANFSDMAQLETLIQAAHIGKQSQVLDLGCGVGMIAEYITDVTGAQVTGMLTPGGQVAIFYSQFWWDHSISRAVLQADHTPLGEALQKAGLKYRSWDFSASAYALMQRKHSIAQLLKADFEAEGRLFLFDHIMAESESSPAPYDPEAATMSRYLYLVDTA
jgi:SAM-dependent methyltransferase